MQSKRIQPLYDFANCVLGFTKISNGGGANRTKASFCCTTFFFSRIGNMDFGELNFAVVERT